MAVIQHHQIVTASGVLLPSNFGTITVPFGGHALQTVTIARNTPRNPQQAIGYKGIVDYTSAAATSDITLDCILIEGGTLCTVADSPAANSSVYRYAALTSGCVLTSCNLGFTTGNPATVAFGYQMAGAAGTFTTSGDPSVSDGDDVAVVLGDDGLGISILGGSGLVTLPSGIQSMNFASTINREQILDIRSVTPIQFVTTYPINVTMDVQYFDTFTVSDTVAQAYLSIGQVSDTSKIYVKIMGLRKVTENESINVGGYLTKTQNFVGTDLFIPLNALS